MQIHCAHQRRVVLTTAQAFSALEALGTPSDTIWPAPRMPFRRTPGPMRVGVTEERHGIIHAVLDRYEPGKAIVWRARVPFLSGTHGFEVATAPDGGALVEHRLEAKLAWWFVPVWVLRISGIHDRLIRALLARLDPPHPRSP